ncbi:hypothetical protein [Silvimonas iriomotensis]|uniref:Uncharacterized protein n=1 Tax=Silvimonas iriomotensis TaxID=449662 RepID=A0ABQ2PDI9_9NEIS|nr:hypothetical protein [Silvimonas iriomotensis]GGP23614.1 hypothetical protein GCM10010970_36140 [Silvimonas iriomotensis]
MSLLDDLKQQAQSQAIDHEQLRQEQERKQREVDEGLRRAFSYFYELTEQLKVIRPANSHRYLIWGVGEWAGLTFDKAATDLRTKRIDATEVAAMLEFAVIWQAPQALVASYTSQAEANYLKDKLWQLGCRLEEKITRNAEARAVRFTVNIEPVLPTRVRFEGLHEEGRIKLTVRNLDELREDSIVIEPKECGPALCEQLACVLLGKPGQIATLLKR